MDPELWSRLPEDLLEHVLSCLPLKTFLRLRSTCKHFKSLIYSPSFISKHSSSSPSYPSFLLFSHPQLQPHYPLYDTILHIWTEMPIPLSSMAPSNAVLLSVSHGLLCFSLPNSSSFLVYNLLARSSTVVDFPTSPFAFELPTLVSSPDGYRLFMICSSGSSSNSAFVYDSRVHQWQQFDRVDSVLGDNYHQGQGGLSYKGHLYFATPAPISILRSDLEIENWEKSMIDLPGGLTFARLASDGDEKLYLIGGIGNHGISRSMKLWELDGDGENWVEIVTVPEMICRKFMSVCYHTYEHVYCFWHQGLICVCCYNWPEILYYKVSSRTWHWLTKCPSLPDKWSCGFRWFSLVPELHALV